MQTLFWGTWSIIISVTFSRIPGLNYSTCSQKYMTLTLLIVYKMYVFTPCSRFIIILWVNAHDSVAIIITTEQLLCV